MLEKDEGWGWDRAWRKGGGQEEGKKKEEEGRGGGREALGQKATRSRRRA